jgi:hypothetical protein
MQSNNDRIGQDALTEKFQELSGIGQHRLRVILAITASSIDGVPYRKQHPAARAGHV